MSLRFLHDSLLVVSRRSLRQVLADQISDLVVGVDFDQVKERLSLLTRDKDDGSVRALRVCESASA